MVIMLYLILITVGILMVAYAIFLFLTFRNKITTATAFKAIMLSSAMAITICFAPYFTPEAKELKRITDERSQIQEAAEDSLTINGELTPYLEERIENHNQSVDTLDTDSFWMKLLTDNDVSQYYINEQSNKTTERSDT